MKYYLILVGEKAIKAIIKTEKGGYESSRKSLDHVLKVLKAAAGAEETLVKSWSPAIPSG